jgi:hypothetical protein
MSISAAKRRSLKSSQFGIPSERKYPTDTLGRARNATARAAQQEKKGRISESTEEAIDRKAHAAIARLGGAKNIRNRKTHADKLRYS